MPESKDDFCCKHCFLQASLKGNKFYILMRQIYFILLLGNWDETSKSKSCLGGRGGQGDLEFVLGWRDSILSLFPSLKSMCYVFSFLYIFFCLL